MNCEVCTAPMDDSVPQEIGEAVQLEDFGYISKDPLYVCAKCYSEFMEWWRGLSEEEREDARKEAIDSGDVIVPS